MPRIFNPEAHAALLRKLTETAPPWAGKPAWEIEHLLEGRARERSGVPLVQQQLFDETECQDG
jgi:hypothetical protein